MKKSVRLLALFALLFQTYFTFAQNDTVYYDAYWSVTTREEAHYFRPPMKAVEGGYRLKDYYISGKLQMECLTRQNDEDIFHGEAVWYYESGEIQQRAHYEEGILDGLYVVYNRNGEKLSEGTYELSSPVEGTFAYLNDSYVSIEEYHNGVPQKVITQDIEGGSKARADYFYDENGAATKGIFYNQDGKLIGEATYSSAGESINGIVVEYFYNPMVVASIQTFKDSKGQGAKVHYYTNGKIKKEEFVEDYVPKKEVYYDQAGKPLGILEYLNASPYNGTQYNFKIDYYNNSGINDLLESSYTYKNGVLSGRSTQYNEKGFLISETDYLNGEEHGEAKFYNEKGELIYEGTYKKGTPVNGSFVSWDGSISTYANGVLTESKKYYPNGPLEYDFSNGRKIFYNTSGQEIAQLIYKNNQPYEGTDIYTDGESSSLTTYHNGVTIGYESWVKNKPILKELYDELGYVAGQETYYKAGVLKQNNTYRQSLITSSTTYDKQGNILGTFQSLPQKNGTEYIFAEDRITGAIQYKNDQVLKKEGYDSEGRLLFSIDYNGAASYYYQGKLIGSATFKNTQPFSGQVFQYSTSASETYQPGNYQDEYSGYGLSDYPTQKAEYKNGLLDGTLTNYEYNYESETYVPSLISQYKAGKKEGREEMYAQGVKTAMYTYEDGVLNGPAEFYDNYGELQGAATYEKGLPEDGTIYESDYYQVISKSYANGQPQGYFTYYSYPDYQINYTEYYEGGELTEKNFYKDGEPAFTISYRDGLPFSGTELEYSTLTRYLNGTKVEVKEYSDEYLTTLVAQTVYTTDANYSVTKYYNSGNKRSETNFIDDLKEGKAFYYADNGKKMGEGTFKEGLPLNGTFIYTDYYNEADYVKLVIEKGIMNAYLYENGVISFTLTGKPGKVENRHRDVQGFLSAIFAINSQKYFD